MQRIFFPGSEWLYIKLYTNEINTNSIIISIAISIAENFKISSLIKQWFYIRYSDPENHIRLRIQLFNESDMYKVLSFINNVLNHSLKNTIIWKIQIDTYDREIERYGENRIDISEMIFCLESKFIPMVLSYKDENLLLYTSILITDKYLDCFKLDLSRKLEFMSSLSNLFNNEFNVQSKNVNKICLEYKHVVEKLLEDNLFSRNWGSINLELNRLVCLVNQLLLKNNVLYLDNSFINSHIHMLNNRLFTKDNRLYELIIYNIMCKYYSSKIVRDSNSVVLI